MRKKIKKTKQVTPWARSPKAPVVTGPRKRIFVWSTFLKDRDIDGFDIQPTKTQAAVL